MIEPKKPLPSLDELQREIDQLKPHGNPQGDLPDASASGFARGTSIAMEFIAGAAIGGAGGYFLDRWLDTSPLFLLTGFCVGFASGVYNLMRRTAKGKE
jgi:ATP synthase protein I